MPRIFESLFVFLVYSRIFAKIAFFQDIALILFFVADANKDSYFGRYVGLWINKSIYKGASK